MLVFWSTYISYANDHNLDMCNSDFCASKEKCIIAKLVSIDTTL